MKYSKPIDINALYSEFSLFDVLNFLLQTKLERKIYNELLQKVSKNFYDIHSIQSFVDFIKNKNNNITQDEYLTHLLDLLLEKSISHLESEIEPDDNLLVNQHFVFQNGHSLIPDCNVNLNYTPKLSPSSIKQINNNPYFYYVKNILNLRPLVFNEQNDLVRQNGILLHRILELFSHYCKNIQNIHDINEDMFIDFVLSRFANLSNNNISLHEKLTSFAPKIVKMEKNAKLHNFEILTEKLVSCVFNKHNLFAIADRIEIDNVNKT
ncbi:MAG: hypothetical protein RL208_588, partial [Pseudomonadota bacterium]